MGYSILGGGQSTKKQAMTGLQQAAKAEQQVNMANENMAMQEKASDKATMATGASMGAMAGVNAASTAAASGALTATAGGGAVAGAGGALTATMGTTIASAAATGGVGLLAAWALTELL